VNVLIACEFSGIVRDEFIKRGHNAVSCDIIASERPGPHIQGDALDAIHAQAWDLMIAHPPCTHLAVSGAKHFYRKRQGQIDALAFVRALMRAPIPRIALENPVSIISTRIRKPDQIIQPYEYGHRERKTTCLWLKGLPRLQPTHIVDAQGYSYVHQEWHGSSREKDRSRTSVGIARAMADQWGIFD
jgi:site-specific DNA-cytosine methylase